jgi:hypothetical protein
LAEAALLLAEQAQGAALKGIALYSALSLPLVVVAALAVAILRKQEQQAALGAVALALKQEVLEIHQTQARRKVITVAMGTTPLQITAAVAAAALTR